MFCTSLTKLKTELNNCNFLTCYILKMEKQQQQQQQQTNKQISKITIIN